MFNTADLYEKYEEELRFFRDHAREFAQAYPALAGSLLLHEENREQADPYVDRLVEGVAFLAARVRLQIESEYPRLAGNILESTFPELLQPIPSMGVVEFLPETKDPNLIDGHF